MANSPVSGQVSLKFIYMYIKNTILTFRTIHPITGTSDDPAHWHIKALNL